jgi:hypothetical protein
MATAHFVTDGDLALLSDEYAHQLVNAILQFITVIT